jgi:hypothetical protein
MADGVYALIAFGALFGGGLLGLLLGLVLHADYRNDATQKIVQTTVGMVSLLSALVLGLLVATAKNKFDTNVKQTEDIAASLMLTDRQFVNYGPDAEPSRALLRQYAVANIAENWPDANAPKPAPNDPPAWKTLEQLQLALSNLKPTSEAQRAELATAAKTVADLAKTEWLRTAQASTHVQHPFIVVMIVWLFILFVSYGVFAPRNPVVVVALLVGALSIAGAVALIVDLDTPFAGFIVVSPDSMLQALSRM